MTRSTTEIGARVRDRRKLLGMSQSELAAHAGVSRKWVSELENGKRTVQLGRVLEVFGILDLHLVRALADTGGAASTVVVPSEILAAEGTASNDVLTDQIRARAEAATFGLDVLAAGLSAVGMDAEGRMVRYEPDGSSTVLE